jgi:large subunit ribosomal protein L25
MSQVTFELSAESRATVGKGASRRLRRTEQVPAILYGGKEKPMMLTLAHRKVMKALENEAFYSHILTLEVDGKKQQAVLKDLQRHPYKPVIMHMDFLRVSATDKINMHVPLHFINEPSIEEGTMLSKHMVEVEIRCLPGNLPEFLEVDLTNVSLEHAVHLTEIKLPAGVELVALSHGHVHDHDAAVASVHRLRVEKEDAESEDSNETPATDSDTSSKDSN